MIFLRSWRFFPILILAALFSLTEVFAECGEDVDCTEQYKWFLTVYGGPHAQPDFYHVLRFDMSFEDDTYIAVAALARGDFGYSTGGVFEVSGGMNIKRL